MRLNLDAGVVRSEILPDELLVGYLGRVVRLNTGTCPRDLTTAVRVLKQISSSDGAHSCDRDALAHGASELVSVTGLRVSWVYQAHTMQPLLEPFTESIPEEILNIQAEGWWSSCSGSSICRDCVNEDLEFHGFSFWRRSHQVQGRCTCPKHGTLLERVLHPWPFSKLPSDWIDGDLTEHLRPLTNALHVRSAARFVALCDGFLDGGFFCSTRKIRVAIALRMKQLSLARSPRHLVGDSLFDYLKKIADLDWLRIVLPIARRWSSDRATTFLVAGDSVPSLFLTNDGEMSRVSDKDALALAALLFKDRSDLDATLAGICEEEDTPFRLGSSHPEGADKYYAVNYRWSGVHPKLIWLFVQDRLTAYRKGRHLPLKNDLMDFRNAGVLMEELPPDDSLDRPYKQLAVALRHLVEESSTKDDALAFAGIQEQAVKELFHRLVSPNADADRHAAENAT